MHCTATVSVKCLSQASDRYVTESKQSSLDLVTDLDYETSASNNLDKLVRPFALSPKHLQT